MVPTCECGNCSNDATVTLELQTFKIALCDNCLANVLTDARNTITERIMIAAYPLATIPDYLKRVAALMDGAEVADWVDDIRANNLHLKKSPLIR